MADYREHYDEILAAGAELVAISVDPPEKSEAVRRQLDLPFSILCDVDRQVVQEWDVYNAAEKGGIAIPAIFIVGSERRVRFRSVDSVAVRVPASEVVGLLRAEAKVFPARRKYYVPRPSEWFRALLNAARLGVRTNTKKP